MNSDTPETDAELHGIKAVCKDDYMLDTMADFARRLERERDEARGEAVRYRSLYYTQLGIDRSASWFPWEAKS